MITFRSRAMVLYTMLVFAVQFVFQAPVLAQTASTTGNSYMGTAGGSSMQNTSTAATPPPVVPTANIQGLPLPSRAVISPALAAAISNGVMSTGNVIIDFGTLPSGTLNHGSNNFTNTGNVYAISTNPLVTTATLQAQNIYNQFGATITTATPTGILAQYANPVRNLNLSLVATQSVVNAGTISSSGNLTVAAGASIINALPEGLPSPSQPVMQAMNNINLNSANIANAGLIESTAGNIHVAASTSTALQSILINNVGGTINALAGAINIRDESFNTKLNATVLGGGILSRQLNLYTGNGLIDVQVDNMTGGLRVRAGDGYISSLSDINVVDVVFTGDPIVKSAGNIIFQSDTDENGNKTGICTGGGQFSGTDALIAGDVQTISISGAILDLSGGAQLGSLPISCASSLIINAQGNINVNSIGAGSAIILKSSGGSVNAGSLSAGDFVQLEAASTVNAGDLTSNAGGVIVHAPDFHVGNIKALSQPGFVDIKAQLGGQLIVGGSSDPNAPPANIASIFMSGVSPTHNAWINVDNPNGVVIRSASAVTINTSGTFSGLSINSQTGTVALPSGVMTFRGGNFAVSADNIVFGTTGGGGTTIDCSDGGGPGGLIFLGATNIDRGLGGLTLNTDGTNNLNSGIGIGGKASVSIVTLFDGVNNQRNISYSGTQAAPFALLGAGPLVATARGSVNGGNIFVDSLSTAALSGGPMTFNADGTGNGNGGFVQMFNNAIVQNVQSPGVKLSANGSQSGNGGFAQAVANFPTSDLTIKTGVLALSATSGLLGGNGGTIDIKAGHKLTVDPAAIALGARGPDSGTTGGDAQRLTLVGGTQGGPLGGGIDFISATALSNEGKGAGHGGLIQIGGFGSDSSVDLLTQGQSINILARGGATGAGGFIQSDVGASINLASAILDASAGPSGDGAGGTIKLTARAIPDGGTGTLSQNAGAMKANGGGTGAGGFILLRGPSINIG